jgi:hypothetical protein
VKDLDPVLPEPKLKYTPAVCVFGRLRDVSELELEAVLVGLVAEHSAAPPDAWARRAEHIGLTPWTLEVCARPREQPLACERQISRQQTFTVRCKRWRHWTSSDDGLAANAPRPAAVS